MLDLLRWDHATFRKINLKTQTLEYQNCQLCMQQAFLICWCLDEEIIKIRQNKHVKDDPEVFNHRLESLSKDAWASP